MKTSKKPLKVRNLYFKYTFLILYLFSNPYVFSQSSELNGTTDLTYRIEEINTELSSLKQRKLNLENDIRILGGIDNIKPNEVLFSKEIMDDLIQDIKKEKNHKKILRTLYSLNNEFTKGFNSITREIYNISGKNSNPEISLTRNRLDDFNPIDRYDFITYDDDDNDVLDYPKFQEFLKVIDNQYSEKRFNIFKDKLLVIVKTPIINIKKKVEEVEGKIEVLTKEKIGLQEKLKSKTDYDKTIFQWGFPVFILFILALYLTPLFFFHKRKVSEKDDPNLDSKIYQLIYGSGLITEIITVFLLTSVILLLGITDKINSEILGTLIGGISGYVLGRSFNRSNNQSNNDT